MGRVLLVTPSQLWSLLLSKIRLSPREFDPGNVSEVTHTGTGQGAVRVTDLPYDAFVAELAITRSGDTDPKIGPVSFTGTGTGQIKVSGRPKGTYSVVIQIMAAGWWRYSLDGGASYSTTLPLPTLHEPEYHIPGSGLELLFIPGNTGFAIGDKYTFSTIGAAQATATVYNIAAPISPLGTGTLTPSGQVSKPFQIVVLILGCGGIGTAKFTYSVNGGRPTDPILMSSSTYTIPCVGITLNFSPGCGPSFFTTGTQWVITTRGSYTFEVFHQPIPLERPEQTGLRLVFEPQGAASPQFVAGDLYSFETTAPPDILDECVAASDEAMAKLRARYYHQQLVCWDKSVTINAGRIALGTLYDRKGQNWSEDRKSIQQKSVDAYAFFLRVGSKLEHPYIVALPLPGIQAPRVVLGPDLERIDEGPFGNGPPWGRGVIVPGFDGDIVRFGR
jgi:hypothetical protein